MTTEFNSLTPELIHQRQNTHDLCRLYSRTPSKGNLKKLTRLFAACGDNVRIEEGFYCDYGDRIFLEDNVYINSRCTFLDGGTIKVGENTLIGPNVQVLTVNHPTHVQQRLNRTNLIDDVQIGRNVWIGAGAIILPGVTIGENAVIGAGSVVTKNIESNTLYAGNPATKVKNLE